MGLEKTVTELRVVPNMERILKYLNNHLIKVIIYVKILKSNIRLDPKQVCTKTSNVKFLSMPIMLPGQ